MNREEVLRNLAEVCRVYKGSLTDHQYLQSVLKWLDEQLPKPEEPENQGHAATS